MKSNYSLAVRQGYYDGITRTCQRFEATFLPQTENTIVDYLFTKPQFSQGSIRFAGGFSVAHPKTDYIHMNVDYGREVLNEALAAIKVKINRV